MTYMGGNERHGNIFKINSDGTDFTNLMNFNGMNGDAPFGSLISDGNHLYGMTSAGSKNNYGTVFKFRIPLSSAR
jgi:uncharacterized repeat protein (TIGR03803 family)